LISTGKLAAEWRRRCVGGYQWRRCANQAGSLGELVEGEAGGFFVECDELPKRRAYMKPRRRGHARAAREKIAADLAHDLGVNADRPVEQRT